MSVTTFAYGKPFDLPNTALAEVVATEIFQGQSYPILHYSYPVKVIVDVGANIGAAAVYFRHHFRDARIICVEPSKEAFEYLRGNALHHHAIETYNLGFSYQDTEAILYSGASDTVTSSLHLNGLSHDTKRQLVKLRNPVQFLYHGLGVEKIDLLKLDTEGHEVPILCALAQEGQLEEIGTIYLEFHNALDFLNIMGIMSSDHRLCHGRITDPHRGELVFVHKKLIERDAGANRLEIKTDFKPPSPS
jgi:FkbM family methyltransferase